MTLPGSNTHVALIEALYDTFNAKDLDGLRQHYHPDVEYVNVPKAIHLKSLDEMSAQWATHAGKVGIALTPLQVFSIPGGVFCQVREVLTTLEGEVFFDGLVGHAYQFEDDLIRRCDILEPDAFIANGAGCATSSA